MAAKPNSTWPADKIERRPVAKLVPYARNSRTHSPEQVDQIAASIREWGWTIPVLIDEKDGIIAGHGRVMAAHKLGIEDVPVMIARGWTEAQKRAYIIADNKLPLNADWDAELLKIEIADLKEDGFDLDLTGFDKGEIEDLFAEPEAEAPDTGSKLSDVKFQIIVTLSSEADQAHWIERLEAEGLECRILTL